MNKFYSTLIVAAALCGTSQIAFAEHPEPITSAPSGRKVEYIKSGWTYTVANYDARNVFIEGKTGSAIWTNNNEVYFMDFMLSNDSKYYIKGRVAGNQVIVDFPQTITSYDWSFNGNSGTDWRIVQLLEKTAEADPNDYIPFPIYKPVAENNCVIFDIEGDKLVMQQKDNNFIVGLTDENGSWVWTGDYDVTWESFKDDGLLTPPDNADYDFDWEMLASGNGKDIAVAFDNDTFWVRGFSSYFPESWIYGTINNDKVTFDSGQYLGVDTDFGQTRYFVAASIQNINGEYMFVHENDIVFNYDKEKNFMSSSESMLVNSSNSDKIYYLEAFQQPIFRKKRTTVESYVPQNPILISWLDPDPAYAPLSSFSFEIPRISVADDLLNSNNLYYRIYTNDDVLFTFYPDDYTNLTEPTEDISWSFNDRFDIVSDGTYHVVYFNIDGIDRIGVQSVYKNGSEEYTSDIVYTASDSVKEIADADVVASEMFNLQGRRVSNSAEKGIYIIRDLHSNGTYTSRKVVRF